MSGPILAFLLTVPLLCHPSLTEATLAGGYHAGPLYASVAITTRMEMEIPLWNYVPQDVMWDFRFGISAAGFDCYLSRFCRHDVFGDSPDIGGLRLVLSWSNWQ
jgi:hypothetical protein